MKTILKFTGLEIPIDRLLFNQNKRKQCTPVPGNWFRIIVDKCPSDIAAMDRLDAWILENMVGRWSAYREQVRSDFSLRTIIFFEDEGDALLFKLMDGGTVWREDSLQLK